jgi:urease accessory protein
VDEPLRLFTEHFPFGAYLGKTTIAMQKVMLPFELRQKTRQRVRVAADVEVGIQLPRGTVLRGGDLLRAPDGALLEVVAAPEPVSTVFSRNAQRLARVAYHLGNRHVPVQVGPGMVRYVQDHVLDAMVAQLGLCVLHEQAPFEPEAGAYGGHSHSLAHAGHGGDRIAFRDLDVAHAHER